MSVTIKAYSQAETRNQVLWVSSVETGTEYLIFYMLISQIQWQLDKKLNQECATISPRKNYILNMSI